MSTLNDQIRSQTETFASDLTALVQRAALEAVRAALGGGQVAPAKASTPNKAAVPAKKPTPAPHAMAKPAAAVKKSTPAPKAMPAKKPAPKVGAKRPPAELAKLVEKLAEYIHANPGLGMEAIGKALTTPTSALTLPIKKLITAKRIRFEGLKRATKYFPR